MQPSVHDEVTHHRVRVDDAIDRFRWRLHEHGQAQRFVHPVRPIVHGLQRQADAQIATRALDHPHIAAHHVVQHLVAAAVAHRIDGRGVVLQIDPVGHDHRCRHDEREHGQVGVVFPAIFVQERAAIEHQPTGALARRDHEGRVTRERPFRAHFRPVGRPTTECAKQALVISVREAEPSGAFATRQPAGLGERTLEADHVVAVRRGHLGPIEQRHRVGDRVVQRGHEMRRSRNADTVRHERVAYLAIVQECRGNARVDFAALSAARAARESCRLWIVARGRTMSHQGHQARKVARQAHPAQRTRRELRAFVERRQVAVGDVRTKSRGERTATRGKGVTQRVERGRRRGEGHAHERHRGTESRSLHGGKRRRGAAGKRLPCVPKRRLLAPRTLRRGDARAGVGHRKGWRQQAGQLRTGHALSRLIRDRHAEESRESERLRCGLRNLERATNHLGTHVDAEHRLHRRHRERGRCGRSQPGELPHQWLLIRELDGALQHPVHRLRRANGIGQSDPIASRVRPSLYEAWRPARAIQHKLPRQTRRQQMLDLSVVTPGKSSLPTLKRTRRGPTGHALQQRGKIGRLQRGWYRQLIDGERDQLLRFLRQLRDGAPKTRQSHKQTHARVPLPHVRPQAIQSALAVGRPRSLSVAKPRTARVAHMLHHEVAPRRVALRLAGGIHEVRHQMHDWERGLVSLQRPPYIVQGQRRPEQLERTSQMCIGQRAGLVARAEPGPRHGQTGAAERGNLACRLVDRPIHVPPPRIHGNEAVERPGGRDPRARDIDGLHCGV